MIVPKLTKTDTSSEFFSRLFQSRDAIHLIHLHLKSFAQHVALDEYYKGVLDMVDSLVESYQGKYGIQEIVVDKSTNNEDNAIKYLEDLANYIDLNKAKLFKDTWVLNQIDSISQLIYSTLYKLKNLS